MRIVKGIAAAAALIVLWFGVPAVLIVAAGWPLPGSVAELVTALQVPALAGGLVVETILPIVGWIAWATFAYSSVVELVAQLRRVRAPKLPAFGAQQALAGTLIAAAIVLLPGFGAGPSGAGAQPVTHDRVATSVAPESAPKLDPVAERHAAEASTATAAADEQQSLEQYVVQPGDTMWDAADEHLGDGAEYTEIWEATAGQEQPVAGPITDPNLIYPGQVLNIPVESDAAGEVTLPATSPPPVEESAPADVDETAPPVVDASAAEADETPAADVEAPQPRTVESVTDQPAAGDSAQGGDEDDSIAQLAFTAGGVAGVLAAGILSVIGIQRLRQRRHRRPGERIVMPVETISDVELELRAVEQPADLATIDRVLRFLGNWAQTTQQQLPELYAIRNAHDELLLYLGARAELPSPFSAVAEDGTAWSVQATEVPELDEAPVTPWPALVTIGQDRTGALLMVDLEYMGAIAIRGDATLTSAAMTALALELATSTWGDALMVTLVGMLPDLPGPLKTSRIRQVDDVDALIVHLQKQARSTQKALEAGGFSTTTQARTAEEHASTWAPEIVLLGATPNEQQLQELGALLEQLPRVGLVIVSTEQVAGEWMLTIESSDDALLAPLDIPVAPQLVSDEEYAAIRDRLAEMEQPATSAPEGFTSTPVVGEAATSVRPVDEHAPRRPHVDVFAEARALRPEHDGPYLRVLGDVDITGHANITSGARPQIGRYLASTVLATFSGAQGITVDEFHRVWWREESPNITKARQRRDQLTSRTRSWLGVDEHDKSYFEDRGSGGRYRTHGVATDWDDFLRLVDVTDLAGCETVRLVAALNLVTGKPFTGLHKLAFNEIYRVREEISSAISDVAHELAQRGLEDGNLQLARFAVSIGRTVDPTAEIHWRTAFTIEDHARNTEALQELVSAYYLQLEDDLDDGEPEPDTQRLLDRLNQRLQGALTA